MSRYRDEPDEPQWKVVENETQNSQGKMKKFSYETWLSLVKDQLIFKMRNQNFDVDLRSSDTTYLAFRCPVTGNDLIIGRPGMNKVSYTPGAIEVCIYEKGSEEDDSPDRYGFISDNNDLDAIVQQSVLLNAAPSS